ncbi:receptor-like protein 9DC3 [Gossypium hirsutum]|uniref:Receptor-like protein 9DC3 n=1 Tax=Gossypium hirsutum TaxID=3635 RepID=A0ABM3A1P7_GOSHI|nr:receptor-like protein 9DC3 [Gossypium hirsutum]
MASYLFLSLFLFFPHLYASFSSSGSHSCSSLIQFKNSFSINQTKDAYYHCNEIAGLQSYPKTNSWKEGTDCCSWDGVTCDHLNAHVIALDLSCSWLYGNFPSNSTLFLLPHLQKLNLAYNHFNLSKMPSEFGRFTSLFYLNLSNTGFVGEVPSQVSHLSKLVSLDLSSWIHDYEPFTIDKHALEGLVHNLTEVRHLFLDGINMSSVNAHVFMNLSSSLRSLSLAGCDLQGKSPKNIFNLPNLNLLYLEGNQLSGKIPRSLGNHLQLTHLDLSRNQLSGQIPLSILNLTQLEYLSIAGNTLKGSIPDEFLKGLKSLESLDLSCNKIQGKIPQWMQEVGNVSLTYLNVSHNSLTEVEHFPWKNIEFLDLSSNLIRGNLPIPASTTNVFLISNNSFNGEVSSLICNVTSLRILDLSHNNLSGTIPQCFGNLSYSLEFLNLKKNKFYGTIPPTFAEGCQLSNFNLNGNLLEGPLTPSILNCNGLEVLDLGNNKINDTFPHWLGSLPFLQVLFEGGIPEVFGKLNLLKGLNLSHNNLNGGIPTSIGNLTSLEWLDLSSNRLSGTIPNRLADLPFLSSFNVSENQLHGQIPQGKQFNTFGNDSYEGNKGLCGFTVSKGCNIIEPAPPNVLEKDGSKSNITFGWKVVLIGYGCGVVFGMSVGYVVFQTGKPKWLVNLVEIQHEKKRRRKSKDGSRRNGRRRI